MSIDYTKMSVNGSTMAPGPSDVSSKWWTLKGEDMAASVAQIVSYIKEHSGALESQRQISSRLYSNSSIMGVNGISYTKLASVQTNTRDRISYNVIQSVIDTVTAKIAKNKPKPLFLTEGGNDKLQRKAKKLDKFVDGVFYENKIHALAQDVFRDSCVWGTGCFYVYANNGRISIERVSPSEIYVDQFESFYGHPRQLHRVKNIDRAVLIDLFPDKKAEILQVNGANTQTTTHVQTIGDLVAVAESWHLPSGDGAKDGKHIITINNVVLFEEDYTKTYYPFVFLPWSKPIYGFWGQGLAEQIQNIQLEINKLLWVIQRSMQLGGSFKVLLENGSKIVKEHVNNDIGAIISYTGTPPQYIVPPMVSPEIYQHLLTLKNAAYEQAGISQLSATSQKPAGLNSGKAMREYNDIETERFQIIGQRYEEMFLELAKVVIGVARDVYSAHDELTVRVPGRKFIETIDWKDVSLEDDEYLMKVFPVSSLPNDPAGRLQTIQEYAQAGYLDQRTARKLLDFPDLEQIENLANAVEDRVTEILDKMIDKGEYTPPDEYLDLNLARTLALQYYNQSINSNVDESRLELIRTFISQVDQLTAEATAPQPGQPGAPGATPPANPMAPPQSDLIPNVNQ